ncbi:hypothetical protein KIN20_016927 [Parelaphostrongylus tenuis]|uniref:Major facilitator superfamily (MFS) profile domain-containing protein n=1 Tax=Parelaphostrongylus tenuis TaxID=148309 RepID=A0AAD5N2H6_PARTN|nr:hypothetical protein KIN20_016927 [Parelaphostrongylus tenuis]
MCQQPPVNDSAPVAVFSLSLIEMKREIQRYFPIHERLHADDFVSFWLTFNQQPGYAPTTNAPTKTVHFDSHNSYDTSTSGSSLTEKPKYLNGGYGWVVVAFSFVLHFIADGLSFSFGVLFPKIQERFGAKRFGASSVASLFLSLPLLLGPIAGFITDVCDCKKTILIGGIICCVGAITSYFCQSILLFTLCFGGFIGVGLSLVYNAAIVIVTYNFELRRGVATALAVSGTGVGTIVFPVFLKFFVPENGTDIGPAIIAITFVLSIIIIIGLIVKDVEWQSDSPEYKMKVFRRRVKKLREDEESMKNQMLDTRHHDIQPRCACSLPVIPTYFQESAKKSEFSSEDHPPRSRSVGTFMNRAPTSEFLSVPEFSVLGGQLKNLEHLDLHVDNSPCTTVHSKTKRRKTTMSVDAIDALVDQPENEFVNLVMEHNSSSDDLENDELSSSSDSKMSNDGDSSSSELSDKCLKLKIYRDHANMENGLQKFDYRHTEPAIPTSSRFLRSSLAPGMTGNRVPAGNAVARYRAPVDLIAYQGKVPSAPTLVVRKKRKNLVARLHLKEISKGIVEEVDLYRRLLQDCSFVLFLMSVTSLYFVLDVPYVFFYDYAVDNLQVEQTSAAWLTSIIGVANLLSTWICGVISDAKCVKSRLFTVYGIAMCGLTACMWMVTFAQDTFGMALICACFGFFISSNYVLQSVMLTSMWEDMRNFQSSYALTSFCEGIATLFGPPVIGYIRDYTGSYYLVFLVSGFLCLISAILSFIVQMVINNRNEKLRHS